MRFFHLLNFQHFILYVFPTLAFMLVFGVGLAYSHFKTADSEKRMDEIYGNYPENIQDRNAPFPLVMTLIIVGTLLWGFFYILGNGLLGVII
ncbi:MAG: hypothetical protein HKM93_11860 [Desulfobacteraceae bacterium]|nr:hypothetical protein [Desulfobacteraceae bacterium]